MSKGTQSQEKTPVCQLFQSLFSEEHLKKFVDLLQSLLMESGFELQQWAENVPSHWPPTKRVSVGEQQTLVHPGDD